MVDIREVSASALVHLRKALIADHIGVRNLNQPKPQTRWFAAYRDGAIVGTAALTIVGDKATISGVWVRPDARGRGIGTAFTQTLLARCDGVRVIEANAYNPAHYLQRGFATIGRPNRAGAQRVRKRQGAAMPAAAVPVTTEMVMVPIGQIKPYQRNPRHNTPTIDKLVELIPKVGFNVPLVLDRQNTIVKGHSRWGAAIRLGMAELPCVYSDADPETIRLDRLADNRVQEFSTWDDELLRSELGSLNLPFDFDLGTLDFNFAMAAPTGEPAMSVSGPGDDGDTGATSATSATLAATSATSNGADATPANAADAPTGPAAPPPQYLEVVCNKCGNHLFVKKEAA